MGWRRGELWLDTELWLPEGAGAPALADFPVPALPSEPPGLAASRRRREASARRRHARRARASAIAISPAVTLMLAGLRADGGRGNRASRRGSAQPDLPLRGRHPRARRARTDAELHVQRKVARVQSKRSRRSSGITRGRSASRTAAASMTARSCRSRGRTGSPGTRSPTAGRTCRTGCTANEHTIRAIISVTHAYRAAHPHAPRVVIGDISRDARRPHGRPRLASERARRRRLLPAPRPRAARADDARRRSITGWRRTSSTDSSPPERRRSSSASSSGFRGPADVVMPWPGHEYHMHVRFPPP